MFIHKLIFKLFLIITLHVISSCTGTYKNKRIENPLVFENNFYPSPIPKEEIVSHSFIKLSYCEKHEQAQWVAYRLTNEMITGDAERSDRFKTDVLVSTGSAHPDDYKKSGFDRGHLAPASDFKFSFQAMQESFYMSNISPQVPGFNRGIWKKLEEQVREWVKRDEELYIITAGVLTDDLPVIGSRNKVSVPKYFYKVLIDVKEPEIKGIAFIMENVSSSYPLSAFAVSIDSIQKLTGIDFFPALEDKLERKLETELEIEKWFR
jgi:endonuclease G, mitochondrial